MSCTSLPILLEETRRSLRNPHLRDLYGHTDDAVEAWCARLHDIGCLLTTPLPDIAPARRDPDDDHVIAAALAAGAEYIVTGDRDLLALGRYETIRIITARRFLDDITAD